MTALTPRKAVEQVLCGGSSSRVPFTIYETLIPRCTAERELRNRGLCLVERRFIGWKSHHPNCKVTQKIYWENGKQFTRTFTETPAGTLTALEEATGFTVWRHEKMFKSPEDFKAILAWIRDEQYEPDYRRFTEAEKSLGEDVILRGSLGLEPMQALISGPFLKMEDFCLQWMENRDELLTLYRALAENHRKLYPLVAKSPALHVNYGGNVVAQIIGPENFRTYYLPHYAEAADVMHQHGKLIGCHFDGNCRILASAIAETPLDYVEAFTPAPDTDMTLAEARSAWPNKVLWLNFPSSIHLLPDAKVKATTLDLLAQAGTPDGLILGITETMPPHRWRDSCRVIMDGLEEMQRASLIQSQGNGTCHAELENQTGRYQDGSTEYSPDHDRSASCPLHGL